MVVGSPPFTAKPHYNNLLIKIGKFHVKFSQTRYNVSVKTPGTYTFQTFSPDCRIDNGLVDTEIELWAPNSTRIVYNDDGGTGVSSKVFYAQVGSNCSRFPTTLKLD